MYKDRARIYYWLRGRGLRPASMPYTHPFDLSCRGKRLELKWSSFSRGKWLFSLQRHGKLDESQVDLYIFRLEDVPGFKKAIHLVVPAPLNKLNVKITLRSLLEYWGRFANRVDLIKA